MKAVGRKYTWTNYQVSSKIDRAIANYNWMTLWPHLEVFVMDPYFSYHSPLCTTVDDQTGRCAKPFRFFNHLADHQDFLQIVDNVWHLSVNGSYMHKVWLKLKNMKHGMQELNI